MVRGGLNDEFEIVVRISQPATCLDQKLGAPALLVRAAPWRILESQNMNRGLGGIHLGTEA